MPKSSRRTPPQRQPSKKHRAPTQPQRRTAPLRPNEATAAHAATLAEAQGPLTSAARPAPATPGGPAGSGQVSAGDPLLTKELQRIGILAAAVAVAMAVLTVLLR